MDFAREEKKKAKALPGMSSMPMQKRIHANARHGVVRSMHPLTQQCKLYIQVPVKVNMVTSGTEYKFERLLVLGQALTLSVEVKSLLLLNFHSMWYNCDLVCEE